jgi:hypothetical protein
LIRRFLVGESRDDLPELLAAAGMALDRPVIEAVADSLNYIDSLSEIAELSTTLLLCYAYAAGAIDLRSEEIGQRCAISAERSQRLVSLTRAVGGRAYLSGRSGRSYLDEQRFTTASLTVSCFELPVPEQGKHLDLSALAALAEGSIICPDRP